MYITKLLLFVLVYFNGTSALTQKQDCVKFEYQSQIKLNPQLRNCDTLTFFLDKNCQHTLVLRNTAIHSGTCDTFRLMRWQIFIDMEGDGEDDWEFSTFLPMNNDIENAENGDLDKIMDDNGNDVPDIFLAPSFSGEEVIVMVPEKFFGNHKTNIRWIVTDDCLQQAICHQKILIKDNKKPIPNGIPVGTRILENQYTSSGADQYFVEVIAGDFNNGSFDNCTSPENLIFTFDSWQPQVEDTIINGRLINISFPHYFDEKGVYFHFPTTNSDVLQKYYVGDLQLWLPSIKSSMKVFNDSYFTSGHFSEQVNVKISVWDENENVDFFYTTLTLHCIPCGGCFLGSRIAGKIATESGDGVENVKVDIYRNQIEYPKSSLSENGLYAFSDITNSHSGSDKVVITAEKNDDPSNGVSTMDLVLLQRHLAGIQNLSSVYKLIAADVNNDQKIDLTDLTEMRKVVLGVKETFPNYSWRFPVANQIFDSTNIYNYQDNIELLITENRDDLDFIAVKIGDLNASALLDFNIQANELRVDSELEFLIKDQKLMSGETFGVPVTASNYDDIFGFQYTLNLTGAEFMEIYPGEIEINKENIGVIDPQRITLSFSSSEMISVPSDKILFTIIARAKTSGFLHEIFSITDDITKKESYQGQDMMIQDIKLIITKENPTIGFQLYQNEPNPFHATTSVSFFMPKADKATLTVYDVTGRVINVRNINAGQGINTEVYKREQLGTSGMLYYQLESGDFTATRKMIIIE